MDLSVCYMGLKLAHPFVMGASPLVDDLDQVKRVVEAGAAAVVMHSLFEEQLRAEQFNRDHVLHAHSESNPEGLSLFPHAPNYPLGPDQYLEQLRKIKQAVDVPVIASLNGVTPSGWLEYAALIEQAGADALELNVYAIASDPKVRAVELESQTVEMVRAVKQHTSLPLAVKLSPFYTSLVNFCQQLHEAGAASLVLFNRFYQPDIDPEQLEVRHSLTLSDSKELLLRLRWLALISGQVPAEYAVTGGVHTLNDAIKSIMAGATTVQMVSQVLAHGPGCFTTLPAELSRWLDEHEYDSLSQMRGSMNLSRCPDPAAFERGNYIRVLQSWYSDRSSRLD